MRRPAATSVSFVNHWPRNERYFCKAKAIEEAETQSRGSILLIMYCAVLCVPCAQESAWYCINKRQSRFEAESQARKEIEAQVCIRAYTVQVL